MCTDILLSTVKHYIKNTRDLKSSPHRQSRDTHAHNTVKLSANDPWYEKDGYNDGEVENC